LSEPKLPEKYEDLAGLIEHALLRTELPEEEVVRACGAAKHYQIASVILRPSDVELGARAITGSSVRAGAEAAGPHGYSATSAKLYEARDLLRRGAQEIDTVMNTGKLVSRQFQYLETELLQMAESCHQSGAVLKVNLESEYLTEELKIVACRVARRAGADFIGTTKAEDVPLLKTHSRDRLKIKMSLAHSDLDTLIALRDAGCLRIQVNDPRAVLDAWKAKLAEAEAAKPQTEKANISERS